MAREEDVFEEDENEDSDFKGDEEEVEEEVEDEEAQGKPKKKNKKRKGAQFFEEEADEEDDDEEEEGGGGRKRPKASRFIDDIAAVDSDEEEEEADEDMDDMLAHNDEDLGGEELGGGGGTAAHYRELDVLRQGGRAEQTEEELAKYLEDKYKEADYDEEDDYGAYGDEEDVGQQGLQPTREDPGLFIVQCRLGCEREVCLQLLQKAYNMAERGQPLAIKSAVCLDHLKGFIYVEAFRDSHVLEAIRGLRTVYSSKGANLVPLRERPAAVTVNRQAKAAIERDSWVRVRGGLYKDDLAKVVDVDYAAGRATVKLVPRLDLAAMAKDHMGGARRNPFGRQAVRPPPRPFRAKEAGELGLPVGQDRSDPNVVSLNTHRFIDGYTLRSYTLKGLILQDVAPPLDEVGRFNQAGHQAEAEDPSDPTSGLRQLLQSMPEGAAARARYVKGDRVVVVAGDLNTLEGTVDDVRVEEGKLLVRPDMMPGEVVELELGEVQKLFKAGDHVRVLSGPHAGEVGMVVSVSEGVCVLLPDSRQGELRVFARDLTEAKDTGTGVETLGGKYELHDLVQLDANTAGVIVSIEQDAARVLTNHSTPKQQDVRLCREADIMRKLPTFRSSTTDASGCVVSTGDYVTVIDPLAAAGRPGAAGARKERGGTVHAISRGVVFLRSTELADKGGFMVVRSKQVRLRGGGAAASAGAANGGATPGGFTPGGTPAPGVLQSPQHAPGAAPQNPFAAGGGGFGGSGGFGGGGGGRGRGHGSALMGQEVTVRSGPYARYKGRVKQETATHLQLELDAVNKIVTVKKQDVFGKPGQPGLPFGAGRGGFALGARPPFGGGGGGFVPGAAAGPPRTPAHVMQTPMHPSMGGATPMHPSRTPLHPSMTPMHPSMTPMHPSMTPMHPSAGGGGDQDYYGRGRPPAAATPGGYGGRPAAATPGGLGGYVPAPTPGTAETPGGAFADPGAARTPGAMAATPGGPDMYGVTAYTPGAYAPAQTPGGGDLAAPSPAPGGGGYGADPYYYPRAGAAGGGLGPGATPGTVATPGMVTGFTPALVGATPGIAYTPGLEGLVGGGGGVPGTPGLGALGGGGAGAAGPDGAGALMAPPGAPPPPRAGGPDYRDVLVKLPGGGVGVGGDARPSGELEAHPLDGGPPVLLEVVELVEVDKKDRVKVVSGDKVGLVGEVMTFDGGDAVLKDGDVVDRSMLGKLRSQQ